MFKCMSLYVWLTFLVTSRQIETRWKKTSEGHCILWHHNKKLVVRLNRLNSNLLSVFCSSLLQVWLSCCWTSCSRRAMVWALVSLFSLQPTSVRPSSGRPSVPPPSTLAEVRALRSNTFWSEAKLTLNLFLQPITLWFLWFLQVLSLKELSLLSSICWPPARIRCAPCEKPSTDKTCPTSWTSLPPSLCLRWSYTSRWAGNTKWMQSQLVHCCFYCREVIRSKYLECRFWNAYIM